MIVKNYRAKSSIPILGMKENPWQYGAYFQMPSTSHCCVPDYLTEEELKEKLKKETRHFIVSYRSTDWGLPNEPTIIEIDPNTLEEYEEWEV